MFLEQINRRLDALKDKMDAQTDAPKKAVKAATKKAAAVAIAGAKTIGIKVEPKLYARIQRYKESRGISSMKKAVVSLCEKALDNLKID